jgi:hypothetical protein
MAPHQAEDPIAHWLRTRFPGGLACPLCRGDQWDTHKVDGLITPGAVTFCASCKHCGNTLLFAPEEIKPPVP